MADGSRSMEMFANPSLARRGAGFILAYVAWSALAPLLADGHFNYVAHQVVGVAFLVAGFVVCRPPLSALRLTFNGARAALGRALGVTAALCAVSLLLRLGCDALGRTPPGTPLFRAVLPGPMVAYILFAVPLQELAFRGLLQGVVREAIGGGRFASAMAVAASTICFGALHLAWGLAFALCTLLPGLVWGIQVERDRTLVGAMLVHAVSGWFFFSGLSMTAVLYGS
jgi:Type II CAAX prenyl endopeptidase Rce1-like